MTCKCLPSDKRAAQICSNQPDTGNCPGKNETREEAAQSKGEKSEAKEESADVVGGGEMEPVPHRVHLVSIAVSVFVMILAEFDKYDILKKELNRVY